MAAFLALIALALITGIPVLLGWTPDTRDPEWSVGRLLDGSSERQTTGWQGNHR